MKISYILLSAFLLLSDPITVLAAEPIDLTACAAVTAAQAEKFIGAPLVVNKIDKKIMLNAPWTHDSLCTYAPQGENTDDPTAAARFLDVSLRFFPTVEAAQAIHQGTLEQFRKMAGDADAPFKVVAITPMEKMADQAFIVELLTDPQSDYRTATIMFFKGTVGGAVSAWKKPGASLELTRAVFHHVLAQLP